MPGATAAARAVYRTPRWRTLSARKLAADPDCERCGRPARIVHHAAAVVDAPSLAFVWENLESVCRTCHGKLHSGVRV